MTADGRIAQTVTFPAPGPYRVEIDVYPKTTGPQPNFQLTSTIRVAGAYTPQPLPPFRAGETVDGFRVTGPNGKPAAFTPWFGALAHAIFFRRGTLDYFHTHVCAPGATGCTSVLGAATVTGTSATPGRLKVGVLVPVAGAWRLFLQCRVGGQVITVPFTLRVS